MLRIVLQLVVAMAALNACNSKTHAGLKAAAQPSDDVLNDGHFDVLTDLSRLPAATSQGTITAKDGMTLAYQAYVNPANKGNVVMISGYNESYVFYTEMFADFYAHGYSVFIMDNRGMGKSGRDPRLASPAIISVQSVEDYVDDEELFMDKVVQPAIAASGLPKAKMLLWAHSTGGLIGAKLLARHPEMFDRAVLNCPLLSMQMPIPLTQAKAMIAQAFAAKIELQYIYSPTPPVLDLSAMTYATNITTHSLARFSAEKAILALPENRDIWQVGPNFAWDNAIFTATDDVASIAAKVTTPVVVIQAGGDQFVNASGENEFCAQAPHCSLHSAAVDASKYGYLAKAKHETFREWDTIRNPVMQSYYEHFDAE